MRWLDRILHPDRRYAARWETSRLVAYYWDGSTPSPHLVFNISFSGCYVETTSRWREGTLITMTLQKAGVRGDGVRPGDYIVVISKVAWANESGAGVEFIPREYAGKENVRCVGSPASKRAIQQFLEACHQGLMAT